MILEIDFEQWEKLADDEKWIYCFLTVRKYLCVMLLYKHLFPMMNQFENLKKRLVFLLDLWVSCIYNECT